MHRDYIHTCDLTAIELEAQSDPVLPSLGSDSDESSQDGLRDPVQDHFRGVRVGMESLQRRNREEQISNEGFFFFFKCPGCNATPVTQINRHTIIHTVNKHVISGPLLWPGKIILLIAGQTDTHFHSPVHAAMA